MLGYIIGIITAATGIDTPPYNVEFISGDNCDGLIYGVKGLDLTGASVQKLVYMLAAHTWHDRPSETSPTHFIGDWPDGHDLQNDF
jgi:hypothetical protein